MFTGLVQDIGTLTACTGTGGGRRLRISSQLASKLPIGGSIAVDGVCLTAIDGSDHSFAVEVSPATARITTLGAAVPGQRVNLELPVALGEPLGGHWVTGHVDGLGRVRSRQPEGDTLWLTIAVPDDARCLLVEKGSVAVAGVSLTIASRSADSFQVMLIPHTLAMTTLGDYTPGSPVNLEYDILGKYVRQLLAPWQERAGKGDTIHDGRTVGPDRG
jgi:riboflavin synthase